MDTSKFENKSIVVFLFLVMVIIGFIGNLKGVLLPAIKQDLGISYTSVGLMIFITSLGYFIATFTGGLIGDKVGQKAVFAIGFILASLGLVGIAYTRSYSLLIITMLILNIGIGCFDIGLNSLAPRVFVVNTAVMMSILHVFFGLGSSASPKLASWMLLKNISWNNIYLYSLILIAAVFIFFILIPSTSASTITATVKLPVTAFLKDKRVWLFIGVLGFCESAESGIGTWLINFLQAERGMNESSSAQYMFYFFIIYTIGRIFGGYIAEKFGYVKTVLTYVSIAAVLFLGGMLLGGAWSILFSMTGFFVSIMFPTIITIIAKEFPHGTSTVMGVVLTAAGLISMTSNWVIGKVTDSLGVSAGFGVIPICASLIIILLFILERYLVFDKKEEYKNVICPDAAG